LQYLPFSNLCLKYLKTLGDARYFRTYVAFRNFFFKIRWGGHFYNVYLFEIIPFELMSLPLIQPVVNNKVALAPSCNLVGNFLNILVTNTLRVNENKSVESSNHDPIIHMCFEYIKWFTVQLLLKSYSHLLRANLKLYLKKLFLMADTN